MHIFIQKIFRGSTDPYTPGQEYILEVKKVKAEEIFSIAKLKIISLEASNKANGSKKFFSK